MQSFGSSYITVGIPVRNAGQTIAKAIESVLAQTFKNYELLIVDDGSSDDTITIIKGFDDDRINLVSNGHHEGIASALNQMIKRAHGTYFARMDADDIMMPERLEKQIQFMKNHAEVDIVGTSAILIDEQGEEIGIRRSIKGLIHPTIMGRTEWFREHLYKEEYSGVEDYELWLRVKDEVNIAHIEEPLLYYRERTSYDVKKVWRERILGIKMIWHERHLFGSFWRAFLQIMYNFCVMAVVPVIHLLHLDKVVILRRNS